MAQWYWRCRGNMSPQEWTLLLGIWHDGEFIGCQDVEAKDFATLKTVSTGSWLRQSVHGRGFGKEMRAAVALYAFDWLGAEVAESEAAAWNQQSLGVSRSLGYELNGVTRAAWGGKRQEAQKVRLTPATFNRPDWTPAGGGPRRHGKIPGHPPRSSNGPHAGPRRPREGDDGAHAVTRSFAKERIAALRTPKVAQRPQRVCMRRV